MKHEVKLLGYFVDKSPDDKINCYNLVIEIDNKLYVNYIDKDSRGDIRDYLKYYNGDKEFKIIFRCIPEHVLKRLKSEILVEDI